MCTVHGMVSHLRALPSPLPLALCLVQDLRWSFGFNASIPGAVVNLSTSKRSALFCISSHTGVIHDTKLDTQFLLQGHVCFFFLYFCLSPACVPPLVLLLNVLLLSSKEVRSLYTLLSPSLSLFVCVSAFVDIFPSAILSLPSL